MATFYPLILVNGEIVESDETTLVTLKFGFPDTTLGGEVLSGDMASTTVVQLGTDLNAGVAVNELLTAPVRIQVATTFTNDLYIYRAKSGGAPSHGEQAYIVAIMTGGNFQIFDQFRTLDDVYISTDNNSGLEFYWSAGYDA